MRHLSWRLSIQPPLSIVYRYHLIQHIYNVLFTTYPLQPTTAPLPAASRNPTSPTPPTPYCAPASAPPSTRFAPKLARDLPTPSTPCSTPGGRPSQRDSIPAPPPCTVCPKLSRTSPKPCGCKPSKQLASVSARNRERQNVRPPTKNKPSKSALTSSRCVKASSTRVCATAIKGLKI